MRCKIIGNLSWIYNKYFNILLFICFISIPFILYWHLFINNIVPISGDGITYFSNKLFINNCFTQGTFPFWNKYLSNGIPCSPDITSGALYPIGLILSLLPFKIYIYFFYAIHLGIGAFFTYLYTRELGCNKIVAFSTALIFELSIRLGGYRKEHMAIICTIIWLPVILYFIERYIKTKNLKPLIICSIVMAFQFFLADIQDVIYTDITVFIYLISRTIIEKIDVKKTIKDIITWVSIYICLIMVQLLPTLQLIYEYIKEGAVGSSFDYAESYSIHFIKLLMMLFPKIFGNDVYQHFGPRFSSEMDIEIFLGVIVFLFILFGIYKYFKEPIIKLATFLMAGSFIYAANAHIPIINKIIYKLPIIGDLRVPSRALFIFSFFGFIIFAVTLSKLKEKNEFIKFQSFLQIVFAIVSGLILTAGIVFLIMSNINGNSIEELKPFYNYVNSAFLPPVLILISFIIILKIMAKLSNNRSEIVFQKIYDLFVIVILIVTISETFPFYVVCRPTNLNELMAENDTIEKIKTSALNSNVWVDLPGIDGGYKSIFSQNSNLIKGVSTLNSYITFNNPRFYKLFSYGQNAPYNCTGLLTGSEDAFYNINLDNDLLSMLNTKFIIDPFHLITEDGSITQILNENSLTYQKDNITIPNNNSQLYVFTGKLNLKPNTYYKIEFNLTSLGDTRSFSVDFYGGAAYDGAIQQKNYYINKCNNKKYCTYLYSGNTSNAKNTQVRIIARPVSNMVFTNFRVSEMETHQIENVYKPYIMTNDYRIFENMRTKKVLYVTPNIQSIKDFDDIYDNGINYNFMTTSYVQDFKNMNLYNVKTEIVIEYFNNNSIKAKINSDGVTFINFSQNYYPGWEAFIDGKETPIYLVNGLIQGIKVPQGSHVIEFKFTSPIMIIGGIITFMGLIIVIWILKNKHKINN